MSSSARDLGCHLEEVCKLELLIGWLLLFQISSQKKDSMQKPEGCPDPVDGTDSFSGFLRFMGSDFKG